MADDPTVLVAHPKQQAFIDAMLSGKFTIGGYGGGIRSGKTAALFLLFMVLCRVFPRSRWAIVRKDLPTLRRNTLPSYDKIKLPWFPKVMHDTWTVHCPNGSQLIFFSESFDTDPQLNRWRGLEVNGFGLEEANELQEGSYHKAIERAGSWIIPGIPEEEQPPPLVVSTFNPCSNWPRQVFYEPWKAGTLAAPFFFQPALIGDNPSVPAKYRKNLENLPEQEYKRFVQGNWDTLEGKALTELDEHIHLQPGFTPPDHWPRFAAFDWGYAHRWSFGLFVTDEDGSPWLVDSVGGRKQRDEEILERIFTFLDGLATSPAMITQVFAGRDCWAERGAFRQDNTLTTAQVFQAAGFTMTQANQARVAGLKVMRSLCAWNRRIAEDGTVEDFTPPRFRMMDTVNNRNVFAVLRGLDLDPDHPEDVLKVDADPYTGRGGDDDYDMVRYGLVSQVDVAPALDTREIQTFSPEVLAAEVERMRRVKDEGARETDPGDFETYHVGI